jgi:hypothetical protein
LFPEEFGGDGEIVGKSVRLNAGAADPKIRVLLLVNSLS